MLNFNQIPASIKEKSNSELRISKLIFIAANYSSLISLGRAFMPLLLNIGMFKKLVKNTIFKQFCAGESLEESKPALQYLFSHNVGVILDFSAEGADEESAYEANKNQILEVIAFSKGNAKIPFACVKATAICSPVLLEKVSSNKTLSDKEKVDYDKYLKRLDDLCMASVKANINLFIDAEESWLQKAIDDSAEMMMKKYNKEKPFIYTTIQFYTKRSVSYLKELLAQKEYKLGLKLVRGAYHIKENEKAHKEGYESPILPNKQATDDSYNEGIRLCMESISNISFCASTHNVISTELVISLMKEKQLNNNYPLIFFSQLYGMGDFITYELARKNYQATKYVPFGPIKETVPYLIRRAEENKGVAHQMGTELRMLNAESKRRKNLEYSL